MLFWVPVSEYSLSLFNTPTFPSFRSVSVTKVTISSTETWEDGLVECFEPAASYCFFFLIFACFPFCLFDFLGCADSFNLAQVFGHLKSCAKIGQGKTTRCLRTGSVPHCVLNNLSPLHINVTTPPSPPKFWRRQNRLRARRARTFFRQPFRPSDRAKHSCNTYCSLPRLALQGTLGIHANREVSLVLEALLFVIVISSLLLFFPQIPHRLRCYTTAKRDPGKRDLSVDWKPGIKTEQEILYFNLQSAVTQNALRSKVPTTVASAYICLEQRQKTNNKIKAHVVTKWPWHALKILNQTEYVALQMRLTTHHSHINSNSIEIVSLIRKALI